MHRRSVAIETDSTLTPDEVGVLDEPNGHRAMYLRPHAISHEH